MNSVTYSVKIVQKNPIEKWSVLREEVLADGSIDRQYLTNPPTDKVSALRQLAKYK